MKKASDILLLINAILCFVSVGIMMISCIVMFVYASPAMGQAIYDGLQNGTISTSVEGTPEQKVASIQTVFLLIGIVFLFVMALWIANAIFNLIARKKMTQTFYIVALVLNILGGMPIGIVGAILGIASPQTLP